GIRDLIVTGVQTCALPIFVGSFPTGVTIVTAVAADGSLRGLTSNAMCAVSLEPPLLLFCLDKRSGSLPVILKTKAFIVNFLAAEIGRASCRKESRLGSTP